MEHRQYPILLLGEFDKFIRLARRHRKRLVDDDMTPAFQCLPGVFSMQSAGRSHDDQLNVASIQERRRRLVNRCLRILAVCVLPAAGRYIQQPHAVERIDERRMEVLTGEAETKDSDTKIRHNENVRMRVNVECGKYLSPCTKYRTRYQPPSSAWLTRAFQSIDYRRI